MNLKTTGFYQVMISTFSIFTSVYLYDNSIFSFRNRDYISGSRPWYCDNMDCFYGVLWSVMLEGGIECVSAKQTLSSCH